jgi:uncharacterized membrane protein YfcA
VNLTLAVIAAILLLAAFTQSLTGFGLALVSMPLLSMVIGLPRATALVAVVSVGVEIVILWQHRAHLHWQPVRRLTLASFAGVPVGIFLLRHAPEAWMLRGLGALLAGYGLYALSGKPLPTLQNTGWGWAAGLLAGALGGAYNTSGPPVILYGHARGWPPETFKANLQAFFLASSSLVFAAHLVAGDIGAATWVQAAAATPALALGLWSGHRAAAFLPPERFRKIVLVALVLLGLKMLW